MAPKYWRVTFLVGPACRRRSVWATNYNDPGAGRLVTFEVVDRYGDEGDPREVVYAAPQDIMRLRAADLSLKYAWLEVR